MSLSEKENAVPIIVTEAKNQTPRRIMIVKLSHTLVYIRYPRPVTNKIAPIIGRNLAITISMVIGVDDSDIE